MNHNLEFATLDINEINPAIYNPRDITEESFIGLKKSISEFGLVDPFIVNKITNNLVGGHQRLKAAKELGFKKVPVVFIEVSNTREKALNITLNNPKISGHYTDALNKILDDIKFESPDFDFEGLKIDELKNFIVHNEWNSDFTSVEKSGENLNGIFAKIIIEVPQEKKEDILEFIKEKFLEAGFDDCNIK